MRDDKDLWAANAPDRPGPGYAPEPEDDAIDLRQILSTLWRGKWIIAICTLVAGVLAFLSVAQQTPVYRATATMLFESQRANVLSTEELIAQQEFTSETLQDQIEILRSTNLIGRVVDELNLDRNPVFNPSLRPPEPSRFDWLTLPSSLEDLMITVGLREADVVQAVTPPAEELARRERLRVINNVNAGLSLSPVRGSRVLNISFTSVNPQLSARIANAFTEQYIVDDLESRLEATRSATAWLADQVEELQQQVEANERAVEEARARLSAEAGQGLEITQEQLSALNASLSQVRSEITQREAQAELLRTALEEGQDLGGITEFRNAAVIASLRARESELLSQQAVLRQSVGENHPSLTRLRAQIEEVRRNMRAEAERVVEAIEVDLASARDREAALVADVRALEDTALSQSKAAVELRQLERQAEASRGLYESLLTRLQEANQEDELQTANARVLSPAEPPLFPESSSKRRTIALGLILGTMAGIGIVFLLDRLNNTFRSPDQLEQMTGRTVLATVPLAGARLSRKDVVRQLREKPNSSLAESIRNLRTSLLFSNVDHPPRVVMFTSSIPREGKSTTSMLTALTSRQMGRSAIIVDCDLRMPALSKVVAEAGEAHGSGLLAVMDGTATLEEAVFKEPETGLHVLMTRSSERLTGINAADVLASHKFRDLVRELAQTYDLVVLDTPPTLVVTDARIVSSLADAVVYVVRWDKTPRQAVLEGLRELTTVDARIAGVAMTMVNEARASRYAYDGYSYYKGRYRDYYEA